jgi:hypothetical protein
MIDPNAETLISLTEAARLLPARRTRPHGVCDTREPHLNRR